MQPGLAHLAQGGHALFVRDALAARYAEHKQQVLREQPERTGLGHADPAVLKAVAEAYGRETGQELVPSAEALTLGMQEDFVVLQDGSGAGATGLCARFLSVCFPSNWDPADKLDRDFLAIHAPVADNARLLAGASGIVDLAFRRASMLRHVWLLSPDPALAQHPHKRRLRWDDAVGAADAPGASGRLLDQVFFRVERQTTLPLPDLTSAVFFIRVMVCPLTEVLAVQAGRAQALHAALASMSDAVWVYRGMDRVRARLLAELAIVVDPNPGAAP